MKIRKVVDITEIRRVYELEGAEPVTFQVRNFREVTMVPSEVRVTYYGSDFHSVDVAGRLVDTGKNETHSFFGEYIPGFLRPFTDPRGHADTR